MGQKGPLGYFRVVFRGTRVGVQEAPGGILGYFWEPTFYTNMIETKVVQNQAPLPEMKNDSEIFSGMLKSMHLGP